MNGMSISISLQAIRFLMSCALGLILGFIYDIIRIFRRNFGLGNVLTIISDILYSITVLLLYGLFVLVVCEGDIRAFLFIGASLGMILYFLAVSQAVIKVGDGIIKFGIILFKILFFPIIWIFKKINVYRQKRSSNHGNHKQKKESG